jgi:hypothetical protein
MLAAMNGMDGGRVHIMMTDTVNAHGAAHQYCLEYQSLLRQVNSAPSCRLISVPRADAYNAAQNSSQGPEEPDQRGASNSFQNEVENSHCGGGIGSGL